MQQKRDSFCIIKLRGKQYCTTISERCCRGAAAMAVKVSQDMSQKPSTVLLLWVSLFDRASWRDPSGVTDTGRTLNIGKKAFGIESNLTPLISESTRYVTKINFTINT